MTKKKYFAPATSVSSGLSGAKLQGLADQFAGPAIGTNTAVPRPLPTRAPTMKSSDDGAGDGTHDGGRLTFPDSVSGPLTVALYVLADPSPMSRHEPCGPTVKFEPSNVKGTTR